MSAFPTVPFHTAPRPRAVVIVVNSHVNHAGGFRAVVAGEDNHCVVRDAELFERSHQVTDDIVQLMDKVTVRTGVCFPFELRCSE